MNMTSRILFLIFGIALCFLTITIFSIKKDMERKIKVFSDHLYLDTFTDINRYKK